MKVTDGRTMRLEDPDPHGIGGQARTYTFLIVRVDTPGLGLELDAAVCHRYLAAGERYFGA